MEEMNWESRVLGSLEKGQAWISGSSQAERALREWLHKGVVGHHRLFAGTQDEEVLRGQRAARKEVWQDITCITPPHTHTSTVSPATWKPS